MQKTHEKADSFTRGTFPTRNPEDVTSCTSAVTMSLRHLVPAAETPPFLLEPGIPHVLPG